MRPWPLFVLVLACAPSVEFRGTSRAPRPSGQLEVYERAPGRAYSVVGWILTDDGAYPLDEHLRRARVEAARHGCDALIWNPNHRLVNGVVSDDATGVWMGDNGFGARPVGLRAACIAWTPSNL